MTVAHVLTLAPSSSLSPSSPYACRVQEAKDLHSIPADLAPLFRAVALCSRVGFTPDPTNLSLPVFDRKVEGPPTETGTAALSSSERLIKPIHITLPIVPPLPLPSQASSASPRA
jgi:hypothetical protein